MFDLVEKFKDKEKVIDAFQHEMTEDGVHPDKWCDKFNEWLLNKSIAELVQINQSK